MKRLAIKKYRVLKTSEYLYTLIEHLHGGLYIQHSPMPFHDVLDAIMERTKKQQIRIGFVHTGDDIQEVCSHGQCDKLCNGFTVDNYPNFVDVGYPYCDVHGLEHIAFMNWKIRRNGGMENA